MLDFLKNYGGLIIIGLFLLLTLTRRGQGGCCGMGHEPVTRQSQDSKEQDGVKKDEHVPGCH